MFQNYLKIALRKLAKQRAYALLNVFGLGLSVGCSILIFALLRHHLSVDKYHDKAESILRIVMDVKTDHHMPFPGVPNPMANTLLAECPIVEKAAMRIAEEEVLISVPNNSGAADKYIEENKFAWIDPAYFEILTLPLLSGNAAALAEPNTVVLSENLAHKYFGNESALGKTLRQENKHELRVVGIMQDLPSNTDYKHEILASIASLKADSIGIQALASWSGARGETYCFATLEKGHQPGEMKAVMDGFTKTHPHPEMADLFQYKAIPMLGLHFDGEYGFDMQKKYLWALGLIGLFLLITACVNFVNMATAQALTRMREVGVRKSLGSTRGQLFWQFMAETGLIVVASLFVGFFFAQMALPYLNTWLNETLRFDQAFLAPLSGFALILGVTLTFLAGAYPGLTQARFNPVTSMKGDADLNHAGGFPLRRVLVTSQFVISQVLIIGAVVVTAQMKYAQEVDWGFRPGAVLTLSVPEQAPMNKLKQQLAQISGVKSVSLCYEPPASSSNNHTGVHFDNRPEPEQWFRNDKAADAQYLETFDLELVAGRNLFPSDTANAFLVNETFVKKLNLASPEDVLNKTIHVDGKRLPIVGVIRDFHNMGLSQEISAITISSSASNYSTCAVQLLPGTPAPVLAQIQQVWESNYPNHFYAHQFMDDRVQAFVQSETKLLRLVSTFAGIAIFVGCLGLYGLAAFMVNRKRKEVGIRKTLGASIGGVLWLFGKEYVRLIVVAFMLAAPLAWWAMNHWLQDYTYRVNITAGVFLISLLTTTAVALLTVGFQSIKAALANPVTSLRSE